MGGKFIVIEGLDGSGKGTQTAMLEKSLKERGINTHLTCEPTQYATGGLIRDALAGLSSRTPHEMAGLFLADRIAHCENPKDGIKALLSRGITVICDRYYFSTLAYQGAEIGYDWLMAANLSCPAILKPDICIFLDVPTSEADRRIALGRSSREIFENAETIEKVRKKYLEALGLLEKTHNIALINAARRPEDVAEDVLAAVLPLYGGV